MSDQGKINPNIKAEAAKSLDIPKGEKVDNPQGGAKSKIKQHHIENQSVYKNPSVSQRELGFEASERVASSHTAKSKALTDNRANKDQGELIRASQTSEAELDSDYDIRSSNPILAAKLGNKKPPKAKPSKGKKDPPSPGIRSKYSSGQPINPRRVQPSIPGRLQSFFDDQITRLDKLDEALNVGMSDRADGHKPQLITDKNMEIRGMYPSLSTIMELDESIINLDRDALVDLLTNYLDQLSEQPELVKVLGDTINEIALAHPGVNNYLRPILQLFMPIPFHFEFRDIDEEFEEDEEETLSNSKHKDKHKQGQDQEDGAEEEEEEEACVSMSVLTMNFNKLHFVIRHNLKDNSMYTDITGDAMAAELLIPVETNLEASIEDDVDDISYAIKTWEDAVLRVSDLRVLKARSEGDLSPALLRACNSVLESIAESDIELADGSSDYELL